MAPSTPQLPALSGESVSRTPRNLFFGLALLLGVMLHLTLHRKTAPVVPGADPRAFGLPAGSTELVERRTLTAKHFRLPDGRQRAVISDTPLHWVDAHNQLRDLVTDFRREANGTDVADQLPFVARVTDAGGSSCPTAPGVGGCMTIGDHADQGAVVYPLPEHATVHGNVAAFRYDDLPCTYTTAHNGVKLGCTVAARRGPHTYRFPYRLVGNADELTVRSDGSAANNFVV